MGVSLLLQIATSGTIWISITEWRFPEIQKIVFSSTSFYIVFLLLRYFLFLWAKCALWITFNILGTFSWFFPDICIP